MNPFSIHLIISASQADALIDQNVSTFTDILEKSLSPRSSKAAASDVASSSTFGATSSAIDAPSRPSRRAEPLRVNYQLLNEAPAHGG